MDPQNWRLSNGFHGHFVPWVCYGTIGAKVPPWSPKAAELGDDPHQGME